MLNILILRNQLFKISESFITSQTESLTSFHPVYIGRKTVGTAPLGADLVTLEQHSFLANLSYSLFRDVSVLKRQINIYKPQIIHAYFGVEAVYALKISQSLGIPLITSFLGFDATTKTTSLITSGKPAWINYVLHKKNLIENGSLFICVSDFIREKVIEMGFPEEKTITHYIGVDVSEPPPSKMEMPYKIILHVARLTEKKGTRYLIEAFSLLSKHDKTTKLIIIGDGYLMAVLKKQVESLGLSKRIQFLGSQPHSVVLDWFTKTDIVCMPSITASSGDTEGLPMTILEASAYKLPVIATYHAGIPEAIEDGVTGFLVPEKNVKALANKLDALLLDDILRQSMGENARRLIKSKFNLKTQTAKLEQLYNMVLKKCMS